MYWNEVTVTTSRELADIAGSILIEEGSGGISVYDRDDLNDILKTQGLTREYIEDALINELNGGDDSVVIVKAYYPEDRPLGPLLKAVENELNDIIGPKNFALKSDVVREEDWANNWKKYYKTFPITSKIIIKPSWEEYDALEDEVVIELDPGMAFGTGTHETTALCAGMLSKYVNENDFVIDTGCGSGILSIIAAKCGAGRVLAIDTDPEAVKVAKANCAANKVSDISEFFSGTLAQCEFYGKSDLIVANIIASVIIDLKDDVIASLKNDGIFITSGIIRDRKDEVRSHYEKAGFVLLESSEDKEWVAMVFKWQGSL